MVGSHTVGTLQRFRHTVRVLARDPPRVPNVLGPLGLEADEIAAGDMTVPESVDAALEGRDAVVHCAAQIGIGGGHGPIATANVDGARAVAGGAVDLQRVAKAIPAKVPLGDVRPDAVRLGPARKRIHDATAWPPTTLSLHSHRCWHRAMPEQKTKTAACCEKRSTHPLTSRSSAMNATCASRRCLHLEGPEPLPKRPGDSTSTIALCQKVWNQAANPWFGATSNSLSTRSAWGVDIPFNINPVP